MVHSEKAVELLIIVGLPGSGKTTYLHELIREGHIDGYCDDYEYGPLKGVDPMLTEKDTQLMNALKGGKRWAVADVRYCDPLERLKLTEALHGAFPNLACRFAYFENNASLCEYNVAVREGPLPRHQLNLIYYYTNVYDIPPGVRVLKVYDAKTQGAAA